MYIVPNTDIKILRNVKIDNSYRNTLYFSSAYAQTNYFISKVKYSQVNYTYQRLERGTMKINILADNLYDCNYMMFRNSNYGSKWFYAFIIGVEYVNNECSLITFQIDEIQSWLFEMQLGECFIERQHSVSDNKYEHIEPESIDTGNMITLSSFLPSVSGSSGDFHDWNLVVCKAPSGDSSVHPFVMNGDVSCAEYYYCKNNSDSVKHFLTNVVSNYDQESIYSVYLFPSVFVGSSAESNENHLIDRGQSKPVDVNISVSVPDSINGYTPVNNRIFSSPFTLYEATDNSGNSQFYYPELFNDSKFNFKVYGKFVGTPEILMTPLSYKGETENFAEGFSIQNFPMSSFASDTFRAWLANNGTQVALNIANNAVAGVTSAVSGNVAGLAYSAIGMTGNINQIAVAYNQPNKLVTTDNSGVTGVLREKVPRVKIKCMTENYLKQVDDYFTVFGYANNTVGVPNIHARPEFTYVKTVGCIVNGNIPSDTMRVISDAFDNGVTWWVNGEHVGQYSLNNRPSS